MAFCAQGVKRKDERASWAGAVAASVIAAALGDGWEMAATGEYWLESEAKMSVARDVLARMAGAVPMNCRPCERMLYSRHRRRSPHSIAR